MKKTKIIATISDRNCTAELIEKLMHAGMDVVRINTAHVTMESAARIVKTVHGVNNAIPIMLDTKGPEIRVTGIDERYEDALTFHAGDTVRVRGTQTAEPSTAEVIYLNTTSAIPSISVGDRLLISDGEIELRVIEKNGDELLCRFSGRRHAASPQERQHSGRIHRPAVSHRA